MTENMWGKAVLLAFINQNFIISIKIPISKHAKRDALQFFNGNTVFLRGRIELPVDYKD